MIHIKTLHFKKDSSGKWHIVLPDWQGVPEDLEMVSGADTWLDIVSDDGDDCVLYMSEIIFEGSHEIRLVAEKSVEQGGGGDYLLHIYKGQVIDLCIWLCEVTSWVWGRLPEALYFKVK